MQGKKSWHKLKDETKEEHALFKQFAEQAWPSLAVFAKHVGLTSGYIAGLARKHKWQSRKSAFIDFKDDTAKVRITELENEVVGKSLKAALQVIDQVLENLQSGADKSVPHSKTLEAVLRMPLAMEKLLTIWDQIQHRRLIESSDLQRVVIQNVVSTTVNPYIDLGGLPPVISSDAEASSEQKL